MTTDSELEESPRRDGEPPIEAPPVIPPVDAIRAALVRQPAPRLLEILQNLGSPDRSTRPPEIAAAIVERLEDARFLDEQLKRLPHSSRMALSLFSLAEATQLPAAGVAHALSALGIEFGPAIGELIRFGLVAPRRDGDGPPAHEIARLLDHPPATLVAHPSAVASARTVLPEGDAPASAGPARQIRECDGLEPILRLAALWQRVEDGPMRRTQQNTLYKRDRERIEEDPVLVGPIADSLEPIPDMASLWLMLARAVGLVIDEPKSDRTVAAPAEFWADNAFHLPQMIASRWIGLRGWHEQAGTLGDDAPALALASPFLRPAVLLWLAKMERDEWLATEDLAALLDRIYPAWSASLLAPAGDGSGETRAAGRIGAEARMRGPSRKKGKANEPEPVGGLALLEAILLGPAYQMGLVRAAEEDPSGRRLVQITDLGRYVLAQGPPPPPRATFEHFLFVQPNFEIVAYRQGLSPALIGQLSRFTNWTQSGAALEVRLTPESVYRGLEGGMTPQKMLDRLARHTARPLPTGVAEALKTWANRRDRITYFASATLVEFVSGEALEEALPLWAEAGRSAPVRISDRLLLVEDGSQIPFDRFRLAGSRDYRRPPEACVEVEQDGVTLSLDVGRSDLFIDAEMLRMSEPIPSSDAVTVRRRFRVTPDSLRRAVEDGLTPQSLARWFDQRAGSEVPPAIRLLLHACSPKAEPPRISRPVVLNSPTADLLDGLMQHPSTRGLLGERLGPTSAVVPDASLERLRLALGEFGLKLL